MNDSHNNRTILMVDDDPDDFFLAREAFEVSGQPGDFRLLPDGEELMDYLCRRGKFTGLANAPFPCLILLDLNMPRKDGREALKEIKKVPYLRRIPIVVFTTSAETEDISLSYELGASSYITKPVTFDGLVEVMESLVDYWLKVVMLPGQHPEDISRQAIL